VPFFFLFSHAHCAHGKREATVYQTWNAECGIDVLNPERYI
jgi:hypothetical protein